MGLREEDGATDKETNKVMETTDGLAVGNANTSQSPKFVLVWKLGKEGVCCG